MCKAKGVDDQEVMTNFEDRGEKKVTREGRGRAGPAQGGDETHRMKRERRKRRTRRKGRQGRQRISAEREDVEG